VGLLSFALKTDDDVGTLRWEGKPAGGKKSPAKARLAYAVVRSARLVSIPDPELDPSHPLLRIARHV
jgi:hypothetical protein